MVNILSEKLLSEKLNSSPMRSANRRNPDQIRIKPATGRRPELSAGSVVANSDEGDYTTTYVV
jgi:hypothetical protein